VFAPPAASTAVLGGREEARIGVTVPIDYSRTLFSGGYRYRSVKTTLAIAAALVVALAVFLFARNVALPDAWRPVPLALVALLCGFAGLMGLWMLTDRSDAFSLTTAGVTLNGRFTPWQDVREFAAEGSPDGRAVRLYFVTNGPAGMIHHLDLSLPLSPQQYERLIATFRAELSDHYPRLQLGGYHTFES
jgi:hypothetical protein